MKMIQQLHLKPKANGKLSGFFHTNFFKIPTKDVLALKEKLLSKPLIA